LGLFVPHCIILGACLLHLH